MNIINKNAQSLEYKYDMQLAESYRESATKIYTNCITTPLNEHCLVLLTIQETTCDDDYKQYQISNMTTEIKHNKKSISELTSNNAQLTDRVTLLERENAIIKDKLNIYDVHEYKLILRQYITDIESKCIEQYIGWTSTISSSIGYDLPPSIIIE